MSQISSNRGEPGVAVKSPQYAYMILCMGFKYGTKDTKPHDIFLILCMTGYWEIINNIIEPFIDTLSPKILSDSYLFT